jgi:hypothetical protein
VENGLPVLLTVYPETFLEAHPEAKAALLHNANSLASHLDLHKTVSFLLEPMLLIR